MPRIRGKAMHNQIRSNRFGADLISELRLVEILTAINNIRVADIVFQIHPVPRQGNLAFEHATPR